MAYQVEGPDPVPRRSIIRPLRTLVVLVLLGVGVFYAGRWGWEQLSQPFGDPELTAAATEEAIPCTPAPQGIESLPKPSAIKVNVYNASGIGGLAAQTAEELSQKGFQIGAVDNDPLGKRISGVGEIRSAPNVKKRVEQLLRYVPGAVWVQDNRPGKTLDFAIGTGFSGVSTPKPLPKQPKDNTEDDIPTC